MIGATIEFSFKVNQTKKGIILDKLNMLEYRKESKKDEEKSVYIVTGYLVQVEGTGEIESIAYWRIKTVTHTKQ